MRFPGGLAFFFAVKITVITSFDIFHTQGSWKSLFFFHFMTKKTSYSTSYTLLRKDAPSEGYSKPFSFC